MRKYFLLLKTTEKTFKGNYKFFITSLLSIIAFFVISLPVFAQKSLEQTVNGIIQNNPLSRSAIISISIKQADTGNTVYEKDSTLLLHPASALKAITTPVVISILGNNYELKTQIYRYKNDVYIKLGADPFFTSEDLNTLLKTAKIKGLNKVKGQIYLDNSIIDDTEYGKGWMWDDEVYPFMSKISAYNINHNIFSIKIIPTEKNKPPKIETFYPVKVINKVITSDCNNVSINKDAPSTQTLILTGTVATPTLLNISVFSPKEFFIFNLQNSLKNNRIKFNHGIKTGKVPASAHLITEIKHDLLNEVSIINKTSDNLGAESLFKIAGGKSTHSRGSTENGFLAFKSFYAKLGLDSSNTFLVDACGTSHYNLITTDWITQALAKIYQSDLRQTYIQTLAIPTEKGTLENRLTELKDKVNAKTGTLSGVSALVGYLNTKSCNTYCFAILIQNFKENSSSAKNLEDKIIHNIWEF